MILRRLRSHRLSDQGGSDLYFFPDRTCGVFALLAFVLTPAVAQDRGQVGGKAIDRSTIARYEKLGAVYGGFVNDGFQAGREKAENNLPGFQFRQFPKAELPQVDVPFGLAFAVNSTVPDGGVRQLAGLKNLTVLSLYYAKVTSAGLKELAVLRNVAALNLGGTKITDDGLKGLAGLRTSPAFLCLPRPFPMPASRNWPPSRVSLRSTCAARRQRIGDCTN